MRTIISWCGGELAVCLVALRVFTLGLRGLLRFIPGRQLFGVRVRVFIWIVGGFGWVLITVWCTHMYTVSSVRGFRICVENLNCLGGPYLSECLFKLLRNVRAGTGGSLRCDDFHSVYTGSSGEFDVVSQDCCSVNTESASKVQCVETTQANLWVQARCAELISR